MHDIGNQWGSALVELPIPLTLLETVQDNASPAADTLDTGDSKDAMTSLTNLHQVCGKQRLGNQGGLHNGFASISRS